MLKVILVSFAVSALTVATFFAGMLYCIPHANLPAFRALETKRLIIRGQDGSIAAEIRSEERSTDLVFFSPEGKAILTLGADKIAPSRGLTFYDERGEPVGAWLHGGQEAAGKLCIGDSEKAARVELGSLAEVIGDPAQVWGLTVRPRFRNTGVVSVYSESGADLRNWKAAIDIKNKK